MLPRLTTDDKVLILVENREITKVSLSLMSIFQRDRLVYSQRESTPGLAVQIVRFSPTVLPDESRVRTASRCGM